MPWQFIAAIITSFCFTVHIHSTIDTTIEEIFTEEHINPLNLEDRSVLLGLFLKELKQPFTLAKLVDAGCGEALWLHDILPHFEYVGFDIVESIIENNRKIFENTAAHFLKLDMTQQSIPQGDLILCRDCFEWFSYYDVYVALEKMKASKSTYLLASTCPEILDNQETSTGIKRNVNLQAWPFCFPQPLERIVEAGGSKRHLAMWKLDDVDLSQLYHAIFPPLTILSKCVGRPLRWEHPGVMNSLRRGLSQRHKDFNVNTDDFNSIKSNVVVVADIDAGLQAYQWKEKKQIATLMVGPNIVSSISEANSFVSWPLIDAYLSHSEWPLKNFIRFNPMLQNRVRIWFAGVDETYWKPKERFHEKESRKVLVYRKTHPDVCNQVEITLQSLGFSVISVSYGSYSQNDYKAMLSECKFAVFVSYSESQGIALAEAWSMDVPTIVWNPKGSIHYAGYEYQNVSSAPYLNPMVGAEWRTWEEFSTLLVNFDKDSLTYQPRRWVLLNMTDKVSAEALINLVREMKNKNEK